MPGRAALGLGPHVLEAGYTSGSSDSRVEQPRDEVYVEDIDSGGEVHLVSASEARYQETDAEICELMSESGIGWPMSDRDEDEEPPPSHILKASRFATGQ